MAERVSQSARQRKRSRSSQSQRDELDDQKRALWPLPCAGERALGSRLYGGRSRVCHEHFRRRRGGACRGEGGAARDARACRTSHIDAQNQARAEGTARSTESLRAQGATEITSQGSSVRLSMRVVL